MEPTILLFSYVVARWHRCLRWCGSSALPRVTGRNRCFSPVMERSRVNVGQPPFFKMQFHYTQHGKKISHRNRRVPRELKQLPPWGFSSLPSRGPCNWKRGPLVDSARWIIFSCPKNCVSPKISVGFLMPTDGHIMWLPGE